MMEGERRQKREDKGQRRKENETGGRRMKWAERKDTTREGKRENKKVEVERKT